MNANQVIPENLVGVLFELSVLKFLPIHYYNYILYECTNMKLGELS